MLRHGAFVQDVLERYRDQFCKLFSPESVDHIESNHRDLLKFYGSDAVLHAAIDRHDKDATLDYDWNSARDNS
jgi:hypothetical protein